MKTTTYRWWIIGISLVVVIGVLALGYWAIRGPTGGQEQVLIEPPAAEVVTGPEQVMTEPQISPEGEEAIVVPGVDIGLEAAISMPAYTLDMAGLAAQTRILPVPVTMWDVATIVPLLGPAIPLTPEEEALILAESLAPYEFLPVEQFVPFFEDEFLPFVEEALSLPVETLEQPEEAMEVPVEEAVTEETEEVPLEDDLFY
ncbi:MAG: hypothetical protein HYY01_13540 [Chloroflexi bacterium]|nr:hypothetical protein [Chloroflexota bacterium]